MRRYINYFFRDKYLIYQPVNQLIEKKLAVRRISATLVPSLKANYLQTKECD